MLLGHPQGERTLRSLPQFLFEREEQKYFIQDEIFLPLSSYIIFYIYFMRTTSRIFAYYRTFTSLYYWKMLKLNYTCIDNALCRVRDRRDMSSERQINVNHSRDNSFVSISLSAASREITRLYSMSMQKNSDKLTLQYNKTFFLFIYLIVGRDIFFKLLPFFIVSVRYSLSSTDI